MPTIEAKTRRLVLDASVRHAHDHGRSRSHMARGSTQLSLVTRQLGLALMFFDTDWLEHSTTGRWIVLSTPIAFWALCFSLMIWAHVLDERRAFYWPAALILIASVYWLPATLSLASF